MAKRQTSITLEEPVFVGWKRSGLKLGHLVKLGLMAQANQPGYSERVAELEEDNKKLQRKLTILMNRVNELEKVTA